MRIRAALALLALAPARVAAPKEIALDRDDLEIASDVVVKPGVYRVRDRNGDGVLHVKRDGVTIDFQGATLAGAAEGASPDAFEGVGIAIEGASGVTVKNAVLRGFRVGIQADRAPRLRVERCDVGGMRRDRLKSTPQREDAGDWLWPHHNDDGEWAKRYGAGIWARACPESLFVGNRARASQNGLILDRSERCKVHDNDLSFLSGWGLAMWRSSRNEIAHNRFDWCVRGYSHEVYDRGQDSAGILVFEQCSENVFAFNSATHGGDGFFLYAGNETLEKTGQGGCNRNLVFGNDFSHAVANGIEATFSDSNVFALNSLRDCSQHGIWGGFSYGTTIVGNSIEAAGGGGISIEHGHDNWIEENSIRDSAVGVELWENETTPFSAKPYGREHETRSARNTIAWNSFSKNRLAIDVRRSGKTSIRSNEFLDDRRIVRAKGPCPELSFESNRFRFTAANAPDALVDNETGAELRVGANYWASFDLAKLARPRVTPGKSLGPAPDPFLPPRERDVRPPKTGGTLDASLPKDALRGRRWILMDEWGPYDFGEPRIVPTEAFAWGTATFHVVGPPSRFAVDKLPDGLEIHDRYGLVPGYFDVRLPHGVSRLVPFELRVKLVDREAPLVARGVVASAEWTVRHWSWPRAGKPENTGPTPDEFRRATAGPPLAESKAEGVDFVWGGGAPAPKVPADGFATVAEATIDFAAAGRYEIETVSDDGIRVTIDGRAVQDDWTWHPPKENRATVDLGKGPHRFRVEHFEIDGFAQLSLTIRPR